MARQMKSRCFRVESCDSSLDRDDPEGLFQQSASSSSPAPVLENPEQQTKWYYKYFLGKYHNNYVGQDSERSSAFALSVLEEKSFGQTQRRAILWTKDGPKRLCLKGDKSNAAPKVILAHFGNAEKMEKSLREVTHPGIQKDLLSLEKQEGSLNFKFGVLYCKGGQILDDELFSNREGSDSFDRFLDLLGARVRLKGWQKYRGGLDVNKDQTGDTSVFTEFEGHEVMFHVSTMLPFTEEDRQQIERKRHIGNDIVNIIFMDGSLQDMLKFKPVFIKSNFTHIYALVCHQSETDTYHLSVFSEKSVPLFGPSLPNPAAFRDHAEFRRFLLVKMINGEKATYNTNAFSSRRERTYDMLLQDMYSLYAAEDSSGGNSGAAAAIPAPTANVNFHSGSWLYQRKRGSSEASKVDAFVKLGQTLKLESLLSGEVQQQQQQGQQQQQQQQQQQKTPWEPLCIFPRFPHAVRCGDSWANSNLVLGTTDGTFLIVHNRPPVLLFDRTVGTVVQLNVIEMFGILVFRTERRNSRSGGTEEGRVFVFRLSDLTEFMEEDEPAIGNGLNVPTWQPRSKADMRDNAIESSKGCYHYCLSREESSSSLKLAMAVGSKKVIVMKWRHQEEWYSLNNDTAAGFETLAELHANETPITLTLLGPEYVHPNTGKQQPQQQQSEQQPDVFQVLVGGKHHFELLSTDEEHRQQQQKLMSFPQGSHGAVSAIEIQEDEDEAIEVLLTYNCVSHLQKLSAGAARTNIIEWSLLPRHVICAFPYILSVTTDAIEFRSAVNGSLLQTLFLPELQLISAKDDLYFSSTRQPASSRKLGLQGPPSSKEEFRYIYKISWILLVGGSSSQLFSPKEHCGGNSGGNNSSCGSEVRKRASSVGNRQPVKARGAAAARAKGVDSTNM